MTRFTALGDLLNTIIDRGVRLVDFSPDADGAPVADLCADLLTSKGEASGRALAHEILSRYAVLDEAERLVFFEALASRFNPDPQAVAQAADAYAADPSAVPLAELFTSVEPPRQELLRRLNTAPDGTERLVAMRADLLPMLRDHPALAAIETDFRHLLRSWFNRGFLVMRPINWSTPASVLEKIIAYEAVHQIDSWEELRRRVEPPDRRCFAFFHPAMPDEPLIFVEVALTDQVPGSIQEVLAEDRSPVAAETAKTAVFYSISNCQAGLAGISFGAFLIKQVAHDLSQDLPGLETFVTLSPLPGFARWLSADPVAEAALPVLSDKSWQTGGADDADAKALLMPLAAHYLLTAKRDKNQPPDPVARFHLGNGAELHAIHWRADTSEKGYAQSAGIMVNYLYKLDKIEANHEVYTADGTIVAARSVRQLAMA
ncbi:MAG: malonyl-CoA decarboxylase [Pseudomonadota bacterium]